jgi:L-ribulokinase
VGQQFLADALNVAISTMETAGEGGPWGMALLAAYMQRKEEGQSLEEYLEKKVFYNAKSITLQPNPAGVEGFRSYISRYEACLDAEKAAAKLQ